MPTETATIVVTHIVGNFGFASRADTGDAVFLPPYFMDRFDAAVDSVIDAVLVPNPDVSKRGECPWKAVAMPAAAVPEPAAEPDLPPRLSAQEVLDHLRMAGVPMRTADIIQDLRHDAPTANTPEGLKWRNDAHHLMIKLHSNGDVASACITAKGGQSKASAVLYALSTDIFTKSWGY